MGSGWASSCLRYDKSSKIKVSRYLQTACNPLMYRRINLQPHKRWQSRVKCDCINFIQRLDPACGTFGFMISAFQYVYKHTNDFMDLDSDQAQFEYEKAFTGCELVHDTHRLALMNAMLHEIEGKITLGDTLSPLGKYLDDYDVVLATNFSGYKYCNRSHQTSGCCCSQYQIRKAC